MSEERSAEVVHVHEALAQLAELDPSKPMKSTPDNSKLESALSHSEILAVYKR